MTTTRQRKAERAVIDHIRECGGIASSFWVSETNARYRAWRRLIQSGRISVAMLPFPNWRVTIHEPKGGRQ